MLPGSKVFAIRVSLDEPEPETTPRGEGAAYGFEQLRETGFSEQEVDEFRARFHGNDIGPAGPCKHRSGLLLDRASVAAAPAQLEREEEWMRVQGSQQRNSSSVENSWHQPLVLPTLQPGEPQGRLGPGRGEHSQLLQAQEFSFGLLVPQLLQGC